MDHGGPHWGLYRDDFEKFHKVPAKERPAKTS